MTNERDDDLARQLTDLFFRSQGADSVFGIMRRVIADVRKHDATHGAIPILTIEPGENGLYHAVSRELGLFISSEDIEELKARIPEVLAAMPFACPVPVDHTTEMPLRELVARRMCDRAESTGDYYWEDYVADADGLIADIREHDATHGILRAQPLTAEQRAEMQAVLRGDAPGFLEMENPEDRWTRDEASACPAGGGSGGEGWRGIESAPSDANFLAWYPPQDGEDGWAEVIEPYRERWGLNNWTKGGVEPVAWQPLPAPPAVHAPETAAESPARSGEEASATR